jgi:hypothetical protein|tara:strand:+ start:474 stop:632 length:159 start_codon:yes stop_codon:yes gene_type:complete
VVALVVRTITVTPVDLEAAVVQVVVLQRRTKVTLVEEVGESIKTPAEAAQEK